MNYQLPRIVALLALLLGPASAPSWAAKEQWVSVSSSHFNVLTTARASEARAWATELERFRVLLQQVVTVPESQLRPVTVVLFATEKDMRPYQPLVHGKPSGVAGLFVNFGDSHAIELSLDRNAAETRRVIFHEVVHWYSSAGAGQLPLWLEEGVAEVYSTFRATRDGKCTFGNVIPEHLKLLSRQPDWSMARVVATTKDSPDYNEGQRASQFYAASWLAVHYLFFANDAVGRSEILRYLAALDRGTAQPLAFAQAFGVNEAEFKAKLVAYMAKGAYASQTLQSPAGQIDSSLVSRPATEAEVQLALATLLIGARPNAAAEAEPRLQRAAALNPGDPVVWQVLGEKAVMEKRLTEAHGYFAKSAAGGSSSYYVYYGLGNSRALDRRAEAIDRTAAAASAQDFRRSLALNPRFVPAYEGLAGVMFAVATPDPKDRTLLEEGIRLAPDSLMIDVGLAACDIRAGRREAGRQRLQLVLDSPQEGQPAARNLATEILHIDNWNGFSETLSDLFARGRYAEAVALIDAVEGNFPETRFRTLLDQNRLEAESFQLINEAVATANAGDRATAAKSLRQVLNSNASVNAKNEAARLLELVARDRPGKPFGR